MKHNYTPEERCALVEFIAMIKGLAGLLLRSEPLLSPIIKLAIHDELQEFIQLNLRLTFGLILILCFIYVFFDISRDSNSYYSGK